ncbi:MAG: hypothetical protein OXT65_01295 [Alphaproteobacteria bacterium]|nr:hypothetical protein [Alphaproteobacteria bacterium]
MDSTAQPQAAARPAEDKILMGEDIEIYPSRPLPDLAPSGAQAFAAKDRRLVSDQFAILCGRATVPRITSIGSYRNIKNPNILKLHGAGVLDWTPEGRQRFALVFEKPPARRLMDAMGVTPVHISEDKIMAALIQPVLSVLYDLHLIDMVHGAINSTNIFLSGAEGSEVAVVGECLSGAPSLRQHALFEPPERAMAQETGRGIGTNKDDLYAFGVCVALAIRGENLMAGLTQEEIVYRKLSEGTYSMVIGRERMPTGISEFLRGVLSDDVSQRWDIEEAMRWLEGRRLSPKQPRANTRAARPFVFRDEKYWDLRSVAAAFTRNVSEAASVIEQDQFDLWIKRNFEDGTLEKHLEDIWDREGSGNRERLVTGISMALDPIGPVRYKGAALFPSGLGNALADAMARDDDLQVYGEIILNQFFPTWINYRFEEIPDASGQLSALEKCRNYLAQKMPGYGMERVLYTLNKECVCMSPVVRNHFVMSPGSLLRALDAVASLPGRPDMVLDRHMIAFISVREPKMVDPYLGYITSPLRANQIIGYLRCLSAIQRRFETGPVPGVSAWMSEMALEAVIRFNDKDLQEEVKKKLEAVKGMGSIHAILELVDDSRTVQEDAQKFNRARAEYAALQSEKAKIMRVLGQKRYVGHATGRQVAMLVSAVISAISILAYLVYLFAGMVN